MRRLLDAQAADERRRWRKDLALSAVFSGVTGLAVLILSDGAPQGTVEREAGRQFWWLFGLFWGFVLWVVRRWRGEFPGGAS